MARFRRLLALGAFAAGAVAVVRRRQAASSSPSPAPPPAPEPGVGAAPVSVATATPPSPEAPGPSVSPVGAPASDTERAERVERTAPDPDLLRDRAGGPVDPLVEEETSAAAAEAAAIGGRVPHEGPGDPALEPVYQAGGGEAEGFEEAEEELIEAASHGDDAPDPTKVAFTPEVETDRSTARFGEPDEEDVTEVIRDPAEQREDPGEGPGLAADR